jgi:predicted kinase
MTTIRDCPPESELGKAESTVSSETEVLTMAASRADVYMARAKIAEDWSAKTADAELRQSWLKIAEEYRLLVRVLVIDQPNPKR